ncbi:MAG TPA: proton-conducting transporter membrane subunit [bacterium]|nr:proton-conducting transporter membrane subunit [bacterium]
MFAAAAFKFGVFPFHMWIPDVYEGAPLSVTAFIATVSKLAAIALFIRLFGETFLHATLALGPVFFWLGALSLLLGSTGALLQKNMRRFLGYSTIANMGIVFIALGLGTAQSYFSAFFYVVVYTAASLAAFGLLLSFNRDLVALDDLKGLHQSKPFTAFLFLILMLSFAGIPPLLGFDAKLLVIMSLIHQSQVGIAVVVVILSVVSAAYALRVIKAIYFDRPLKTEDFACKPSFGRVCVALNALALLGFGLFPLPLISLVQRVFM